ncbi:hypothetical protein Tsubulata_018008 [Turnera subulata]|uniref:Uncharacterized protein n=1 Tax=Turnera subulata TaxID=218843 RepID=A0A9Q0JLP7_9ROSI|nr:hypothetical protein Tsubulata_018008 [Turnera subulata]
MDGGSRPRSVWFSLEVEGRGGGGRGERLEWYNFKLSSSSDEDDVKCETRDPGCFCCRHVHRDLRDCPSLLSPRAVSWEDEKDPRGDEHGWGLLGDHLYRLGGHRAIQVGEEKLKPANPGFWNCLGPMPRALRSVDALDLTRPEEGWKPRPRMLTRRYEPAAVAAGGKLYVYFGRREQEEEAAAAGKLGAYGEGDDDSDYEGGPWAEVYDPATNAWTALPDLPSGFSLCEAGIQSGVVLKNGRHLIVLIDIARGQVVVYDTVANSWKQHCEDLPKLKNLSPPYAGRGPAVAVRQTLYWFSAETGNLFAYDLDREVVYSSELVDFTFAFGSCSFTMGDPILGHLGGNRFCLLYQTSPDDAEPRTIANRKSYRKPSRQKQYEYYDNRRLLHCLKFEVAKQEARRLNVTLLSCQSSLIKIGALKGGFFV